MSTAAPERERADELLRGLVEMFESGDLPEAVAQTQLRRLAGTRPMDSWSIGNQLIALANGTTDARTLKAWNEIGRRVKPGAKAFYILRPRTRMITDEETGRKRPICIGFADTPRFAIEDTEGDPVEYPTYTPAELPPLADVAEGLGIPVSYAPMGDGSRGYYRTDTGEIVLGTHDVDTWFHELAHAAHAKVERLRGGQDARQEIVAETVAAVLCRLYGFDGYLAEARDYIGAYARGDEPHKVVMKFFGDVQAVLDVILGKREEIPA